LRECEALDNREQILDRLSTPSKASKYYDPITTIARDSSSLVNRPVELIAIVREILAAKVRFVDKWAITILLLKVK
jgi:hypothetical protein